MDFTLNTAKKLAPVVRELGYPSKRNLRRRIRLWEASDGATEAIRRKPRYSDVQKQAAVEHYLNRGCCLAFTSRTLGYPCCDVLARWVNERHPDRRLIFTSTINQNAPFEPEFKRQAVMALCTRHEPASEIAACQFTTLVEANVLRVDCPEHGCLTSEKQPSSSWSYQS